MEVRVFLGTPVRSPLAFNKRAFFVRKLEELGLESHYNTANPAKWMASATDVYELVNFFESQNTSYEVDTRAVQKKTAYGMCE